MRRDKLDILKDILAICVAKAKKTQIVYGSNTNFAKADCYIDWLLAHEYLKKDDNFYEITPAGLLLLSNLNKIVDHQSGTE